MINSFVTIWIFARTELIMLPACFTMSFVTIWIFARTEQIRPNDALILSFVTIKIFARTELLFYRCQVKDGFVTIKIFARTELSLQYLRSSLRFVTIRIFARTDLKNEKGSDTPPARKGRGPLPLTFYCVNVNYTRKNLNIWLKGIWCFFVNTIQINLVHFVTVYFC